MKILRQTAIALIVAGLLILTYSGISYTARLDGFEDSARYFSADSSATVNVPFWTGFACLVVGGLFLSLHRRA